MSVLNIPDNVLQKAGISSQEALLELACRLFDTGRLSLSDSAKLAGMSAQQFEGFLTTKGIPMHLFNEANLKDDVQSIEKSGA